MAFRMQTTTPFKSGQNTSSHEKSGDKVRVNFKMAYQRNAGQPDALKQSLTSPPREFSDTQHFEKRPPQPKGHQYLPKWAPLRGKSEISSKATNMKSYSSKPGQNAVGSHSNRKGENALGRAMNKVGTNAIGNNLNRKGSHA